MRAGVLIFCLLASFGVHSRELFGDPQPLSIELKGPINKVIRAKHKETPHPFVLTIDGQAISVEVNARGNSRKSLCSFPPLKLTFLDEDLQSVFSGRSNLRLVTHCLGTKSGNDKVLLEYLAYRIFNVLSDVSYRARLLDITYVDSDKVKKGTIRAYGFVTESEHELAHRVDGVLSSQKQVVRKALDQRHAALVNLFHYLIGNTDWSLVTPYNEKKCCHNGQLIELNDMIYIAPYDFDLSGLVKARYAKPNPELPIARVTTRHYQGVCVSEKELEMALLDIHQKREAIVTLIAELPSLSSKEEKRVKKYLRGFFDKTQDVSKFVSKMARRCV